MEKTLRPPPHELTDQKLLEELPRPARLEERVACVLVAHLVEMERRQLDRAAGYKSIYDYCVNRLGLSEDAAWNRMAATRVARKFPLALELLTSGALRLTALRLLEKVLTEANHREILEAARHKSKREVELLIAEVAPRPDVRASVRKLPASKAAPAPAAGLPLEPAAACPAPARPSSKATRPVVEPLAPGRFLVQFTVGAASKARLVRAQELLGRQVAPGDLEAVFDQAIELLVQKLEKRKNGATDRPRKNPRPTRPGSRHVPAEVKRAVQARDGGQCAYVGRDGRRCTARGGLEYGHLHAHALGGPMTLANLALRCRAHNVFEAEQCFGPWRGKRAVRESPPPYGSHARDPRDPAPARPFRNDWVAGP
jgi:hypothetical protein